MVENEDDDDPTKETVTFLYKYTSGSCPKSYGFNAAKLAGMSLSIIRRANEVKLNFFIYYYSYIIYASQLSRKMECDALKRKLVSKILAKANIDEVKDLVQKIKRFIIKSA